MMSRSRYMLAAALLTGTLGFAGTAQAQSELSWSLSIGTPGVVVPGPVYYEAAPVYVRPRPVYRGPHRHYRRGLRARRHVGRHHRGYRGPRHAVRRGHHHRRHR